MEMMTSEGQEYQAAEGLLEGRKHWGLDDLGVDPAYQGKGIGSLLLEWGLKKADEAGLEVFCLSSEEVRNQSESCPRQGIGLIKLQGWKLYAKRGFELLKWVDFRASGGRVIKERALLRPSSDKGV